MADVFISYKSERRAAARHLGKVLDAYGYEVWYDYGLIPGDDFELRLMAELAAAKAVVVLWCTMAVTSTWVNQEAREAKREGKYLPCWIENAMLPAEFATADTINLTTWDGAPRSYMLDRLLGDIARRLGRDPSINFNRLRELDEDWRGYGAPSLAQFALGQTLTPDAPVQSQLAAPSARLLGDPPAGLSTNLAQHWDNARRGGAAALFAIASAYGNAIGGLPKDEKEAVRLYKLAADQNDAAAHSNLGTMYQTGRGGLPKDEKEAVRLYRLAADQGYAGAQSNLGIMYQSGSGGLPKDEKEAVRLYKLAADQGHAGAQSNLGFMYQTGRGGLPKNAKEAVRLYKLGADQGYAGAQSNLGFMYESGVGLPKDESEAVRLYKLAADQGYAVAQRNLGVMYENGRGGLPKDEKEAVRLYTLAAQQQYPWAQERLKKLGKSW